MITGDNSLTAAHIATKLNIITRAALILDVDGSGKCFTKNHDHSCRPNEAAITG
jgi:magnesium-transporting ATPase (P-type)